MQFCEVCRNMLYTRLDEDKNMINYCKNCNNSVVHTVADGSKVLIQDNKIDDITKYSQYINPNIQSDPTLPRVNNISCPNTECSKKEEEPNEVIYVKYDFQNMRYLYHCCYCNQFWKSE